MRSRRHFSGVPSLERYSRSGISVAARTPSQEQPAAPSALQSRASIAFAGRTARPYRHLHGATTSAAMARRSRDRTAWKPGQL